MDNQTVPNFIPQAPSPVSPVMLSFIKGPKVIFVILGLVIVAEVVFMLKSILFPQVSQPSSQVVSIKHLQGGKITVFSEKNQYKVGEIIPVQIRITTGGKLIDGVDVVIKYDASALDITNSDLSKGSIFGDYPLLDVKKGLVKISGIATFNQASFNGLGVLATLNFKAKKIGQTSVSINYTLGSTTDSNLIQSKSATDILSSVDNLNLTIGNESGKSSQTACSTRVLQQCVDPAGKTGTFWCASALDSSFCKIGCFQEKNGSTVGCKAVSAGVSK